MKQFQAPHYIVTHKSFYDLESAELIPSLYLVPEHLTPEEALQMLWQNHYESESHECMVAGGIPIDESETYCVDGYARITWMDGDYVEYHLSQPTKVHEEVFKTQTQALTR